MATRQIPPVPSQSMPPTGIAGETTQPLIASQIPIPTRSPRRRSWRWWKASLYCDCALPHDAAATSYAMKLNAREERIFDDDGNGIIVQFICEPTVETYGFLKDYLEFRAERLRLALKSREMGEDTL